MTDSENAFEKRRGSGSKQSESKAAKHPSTGDEKPWYHDGLPFECTGCGQCCTGEPGYVWVIQEEIDRMAESLGVDVESFEAKYVRKIGRRRSLIELVGGDCVFFDDTTRHCTIYDARPRQCQTWPFWESNVRTPSHWRDVCEVCPGVRQGRIVPLVDIEAKKAIVRI
jgi:Fe-S-cluster containining protein